MVSRIKNIVVSIAFIFIITAIFFINIFQSPKEVSYSERRRLAQFPPFSAKALVDGQWIRDFEKYTMDQFAFRENFRTLKAFTLFNIFAQKDNNDIYIVGDSVFKIEYPLKESSVKKAAKKFNDIYNTYLKGMRVFYSIIPDKNYFVAEQNGYPSMDYDKLVEIMNNNMKSMHYIDIFDCLTIEDFYRTDLHWRQECFKDVVARLSEEMGFSKDISAAQYTAVEKYPFYGAFYGQSALPIKPDNMIYLTNKTIESAAVYNYETGNYTDIYDLDKFGKMDSYDIFLSGPVSLITIENQEAETDKELIIFRDSFGSSLAPLLIEEYSKITLVDLRYIPAAKLGEFIDFESQDVLFLYSTLVLNNSDMLK